MENKYLLAAIIAIVAGAFAISVASAQNSKNAGENTPMMSGSSMESMMSMMGMMQGNFVHDQNDIDWMKEDMKEYMNLTDEEVKKMDEHCPMMRGR